MSRRLKMTKEQIEREQIEQVFRLTGGELSDSPLVFPETSEDGKTFETHAPTTFHHWYEQPPEWAASDLVRDYEDASRDYFTAVRSVMYGEPAQFLRLANGETWERVEVYQSSGETECPFKTWDPVENEDATDAKVTRNTAQLEPKPEVRRDSPRWYGDKRPNARQARCPFCEARIGEEHGYIYLGDGMAEVVYRRVVASKEDREDLRDELADAIEHDHPGGSCGNTCDIDKALEDGYVLWAAHILMGATECERTERVYGLIAPTAEELEEERKLLLDAPHGTCPKCNALVWFGTYYDETVTCGCCHAEVKTDKYEEPEPEDNASCPSCGHYNAMLATWTPTGTVQKCRDCGHEAKPANA